MPCLYASIVPHSLNLIPETAAQPERVAKTYHTLEAMGARLEALAPEVIVLITPHGFRAQGALSLCAAEKARGDWSATIQMEFELEAAFTARLARAASERGLPIIQYIYGASSGPHCAVPLDWGAVVPLYFNGHRFRPQPALVLISPMKTLGSGVHYAFGEVLGAHLQADPRRIAVIASADQGHAHHSEGPYGYHPAAAAYDAHMQRLIQEQRLSELIALEPELVEQAKPDSLWPTLILAGALTTAALTGQVQSYEIDHYFGILCAEYLPAQ